MAPLNNLCICISVASEEAYCGLYEVSKSQNYTCCAAFITFRKSPYIYILIFFLSFVVIVEISIT